MDVINKPNRIGVGQFIQCLFFLICYSHVIEGQQNNRWILNENLMLNFEKEQPEVVEIYIEDSNDWAGFTRSYSVYSNKTDGLLLCFDGFELRNSNLSYSNTFHMDQSFPEFFLKGDAYSFQSNMIVSLDENDTDFLTIYSQSTDQSIHISKGELKLARFHVEDDVILVSVADSLISNQMSEAMTILDKGCGQLVLIGRSLSDDSFKLFTVNQKGFHRLKTIPSQHVNYRISGNFYEELVSSKQGSFVILNNYDGISHLYNFQHDNDSLIFIADLSQNERTIVGEFSEDEKSLFIMETEYLKYQLYRRTFVQYDISSKDPDYIRASRKEIMVDTNRHSEISDLRIGPDGKIYVSNPNTEHVGTLGINNQGDYNYIADYITLPRRKVKFYNNLGTNSYKIRNYPKQLFNTKNLDVCTFPQTIQSDVQADYYHWSNGHMSPSIQVDSAGIYWLDAIVDGCTITDSITVRLSNTGMSELAPTYMLCADSTLELTITDPKAHNILWSTGQISNNISLNMPGSYGVSYQVDDCKIDSDFEISESSNAIQIDSDQELCEGQSIALSVVGLEENQQFLWSTGENQDQIEVSQAGQYSLVTTNADGCQRTDHIEVSTMPKTVIRPLRDTTICDSSSLTLQIDGTPWYWNDTLLAASYTITTSQRVHAYNPITCTTTDTISVTTEDCSQTIDCRLFLPNAVSTSVAEIVDHSYTAFATCPLEQYIMYVFDRWGNQVYISHTIDNGLEVEDYPLGVYVAKFEYRFSGDIRDRLKYGTFTVF